MHEQKVEQAALLKVAYIDLDEPVAEKPPGFALFEGTGLTLHGVLERLAMAGGDKDVRAVLVRIGATGFNLAQAAELRDGLIAVRKAGKRIFVYADSYDTPSYVVASGATDICLLEGGEIMIPGIGIETMFAKDLLDKLGIQADYVQIGEFKGADEQYTRAEASKELRGEMNKLVDALFGQLVDGIAAARNIPRSRVEELVDQTVATANVALERGLIDHAVDEDGLRDLMTSELGHDINLVADYGLPEKPTLDFSNIFVLMQQLSRKEPEVRRPAIAVIYAQGMIVDGSADNGIFGGSETIGSDDLRKAFRVASRDDQVEAIVLRIDSPGGSALASEAMWQAARRAAGDKPLIVSVGSMAASGGYYLASAGDRIFADPSAIVGSIGVVGGKFVFKKLFDETLGLHTETFARGRNAGLFSSSEPWSDQQRRMVTNWMKQTYDQFTDRVMSQRKGKIKAIDDVARGRVFVARQALDLGMVDELGGIEAAIAYAASEAELKPGTYDVKAVPATRTLGDLLRGGDGADAATPLRISTSAAQLEILKSLSPQAANMLRQHLQMAQIMSRRPIMLMSPLRVNCN